MKKITSTLIIILFLFVTFMGIFSNSNEVQADTNLTIKYKWTDNDENAYGVSYTLLKFTLQVYEGSTDKAVEFKASIYKDGDDKNVLGRKKR